MLVAPMVTGSGVRVSLRRFWPGEVDLLVDGQFERPCDTTMTMTMTMTHSEKSHNRSNEGLALQARVSGPWPHKKESVLQVQLAPWQGVQVQTDVDMSVMHRVER